MPANNDGGGSGSGKTICGYNALGVWVCTPDTGTTFPRRRQGSVVQWLVNLARTIVAQVEVRQSLSAHDPGPIGWVYLSPNERSDTQSAYAREQVEWPHEPAARAIAEANFYSRRGMILHQLMPLVAQRNTPAVAIELAQLLTKLEFLKDATTVLTPALPTQLDNVSTLVAEQHTIALTALRTLADILASLKDYEQQQRVEEAIDRLNGKQK